MFVQPMHPHPFFRQKHLDFYQGLHLLIRALELKNEYRSQACISWSLGTKCLQLFMYFFFWDTIEAKPVPRVGT